jgi:hypothetical protein
LLEARGTEDCIANDQQRPAVTELLDGLSDAAVDVVEACSGHPRRPRRILITGCFKLLSIRGYGSGSGASRGSYDANARMAIMDKLDERRARLDPGFNTDDE